MFLYYWAIFLQHFLLRQQIPTKNNKCKKLGVVAFGRSNKKFQQIFSYHHVGAHLKKIGVRAQQHIRKIA